MTHASLILWQIESGERLGCTGDTDEMICVHVVGWQHMCVDRKHMCRGRAAGTAEHDSVLATRRLAETTCGCLHTDSEWRTTDC